uniref:Uncharacterized protein LOC101490268 n=1 Tax=Cicer arietinum TaxID=3827 RepID=A0A1S3DUW1_CICAR|nr:uncharacterized protein LOC101490268 [Cicer arietinum]
MDQRKYVNSRRLLSIRSPRLTIPPGISPTALLDSPITLPNSQYILPHENEKLSQVDLLVIDKAAAIPLPMVKYLLGQYLVFLSFTVNGSSLMYQFVHFALAKL